MDPDDPFRNVAEIFEDELTDFDVQAVEALLATVLANQISGDPLWLILIAPPASGKTFMLGPLQGIWGCILLSSVTPNTFLSGTMEAGGGDPSLLNKLGRRPFVVIKDLGTILQMHPNERDEVFGQLREVYDGQISKSFGTGVRREWEGKMTLIAAMTHAIDRDRHQGLASDLGERFLRLRFSEPEDKVDMALGSIEMAGDEDEVQSRINHAYREALQEGRHYLDTETVDLSYVEKKRCACLAIIAARARTTITDGLAPEPELPPRLTKQLVYLARGQRALHQWDQVRDWSLLRRVAIDVIPEPRRGMLQEAGRRILSDDGQYEDGVTISEMEYMSARHRRRIIGEELTALDILTESDETPETDGDKGRNPVGFTFTDDFEDWRSYAGLDFTDF